MREGERKAEIGTPFAKASEGKKLKAEMVLGVLGSEFGVMGERE